MRKLKEFGTSEGLDIYVQLTEPTAALANNAALKDMLLAAAKAKREGDEAEQDIATARKLIPLLLKECREQVMQIIGIINGDDAEAYGAAKFYEEMLHWMQDTDFWTFFASFVEMNPAE